jgi:hypothetical protein
MWPAQTDGSYGPHKSGSSARGLRNLDDRERVVGHLHKFSCILRRSDDQCTD